MGYSVDWILRQTDGVGWDVTTDDGVNAFPVNGSEHPPDPSYIPRWRAADRRPGAAAGRRRRPGAAGRAGHRGHLRDLEALQTQQANDTAAILARDDANTQRILDMIDSIKTQVEESLQKTLFLYLRRREEDEDTGGVV